MRIARTFQTAPAAVPKENTAKYLDSALDATGFQAPDWLVPDIEDGTAPDMKAEGLENTVDRLAGGVEFPGEIWPRVQWAYDDERLRSQGETEIRTLVEEVGETLTGVVVPKVGRVADVERALEVLAGAEADAGLPEGSLELSVIVETAAARSDLREIAMLGESGRLAGMIFGPVDYTAELGGRAIDGDRPRWDGLLEALSNEASANDVVAIGGPFDKLFAERAGVTYYNAPAYADQVEREAAVGLDGSWSLYPKQTVQANRVHMPTVEELERDVSKIERFDAAKAEGTGAVTVDGQMVDEATFKNFANTVEAVRTIHARHPDQTGEVYDDDLLSRALELDTDWRR
ncbi:citrate lyase subunit beta [Halorubellus sp. JP-L1]|uniref:L-malyl-CoA/beta-methylmalyl-CoA lyase n=1 Tax=Halorubellus sp. JP-L1 TaxID=2715753 RepID=UPI00140B1804|nr:L-malyl-CoA/beta-methylmalyl-CoA lyase [Halorubellus sp. JP-L1]NHN40575.1 citrate lyase subunit beta [Halorubellus sp. JP-L1]